MPNCTFLILAVALAAVFLAHTAAPTHAHAILTSPPARPGSNGPDNKGIKIPSPDDSKFFSTCGNAATQPGPPSATFTAGRPQLVKWDITIDHLSDPGVSVALRCTGQQAFTPLVRGVKAQERQVQVAVPPGTRAGNCELQWIWTSREDGGSYVACADIRVVEAPASSSSSVAPTPIADAPASATTTAAAAAKTSSAAAAKTSSASASAREHVTHWLRAGIAGLFVAAVVASIGGR